MVRVHDRPSPGTLTACSRSSRWRVADAATCGRSTRNVVSCTLAHACQSRAPYLSRRSDTDCDRPPAPDPRSSAGGVAAGPESPGQAAVALECPAGDREIIGEALYGDPRSSSRPRPARRCGSFSAATFARCSSFASCGSPRGTAKLQLLAQRDCHPIASVLLVARAGRCESRRGERLRERAARSLSDETTTNPRSRRRNAVGRLLRPRVTAIASSAQNSYPTRWMRDKSVDTGSTPRYRRISAVASSTPPSSGASSTPPFPSSGKRKAHIYPQTQCGSHYQDDVITERRLNGPLGSRLGARSPHV